MKIDNLLAALDFHREETLVSKYFVHYTNNGGQHVFLFKDLKDGSAKFSSPSGEWRGNIYDLINFYHDTDNSSSFNEADRMELFIRANDAKKWDLTSGIEELEPVAHFNLYKLLFKQYGHCKDPVFGNALESPDMMYFFFMDEDITPSQQHNILGVVTYDKKTREETTVHFSDLGRSIYFSDPSIASREAVIFNSFREMVAFRSRMATDFFYIVFKGSFNTVKAKTINLLCGTKGITKTYLAFPDRLEGYYRDIEYLGVFAGMDIKDKTGFLKLSVPQSVWSDIFIGRLKDLKASIEKDLERNDIRGLISIKGGRDLNGSPVFVIEIARIANILKGFLVLASKYLLTEKDFRIVKPKGVYWSEDRANIKNVGTEFKLNIYDTIGEVYQYN